MDPTLNCLWFFRKYRKAFIADYRMHGYIGGPDHFASPNTCGSVMVYLVGFRCCLDPTSCRRTDMGIHRTGIQLDPTPGVVLEAEKDERIGRYESGILNFYFTLPPLLISFVGATKASSPLSFSAIKIIPCDSMPFILRGARFTRMDTFCPIMSSGL